LASQKIHQEEKTTIVSWIKECDLFHPKLRAPKIRSHSRVIKIRIFITMLDIKLEVVNANDKLIG
jgi:hypothetical protein